MPNNIHQQALIIAKRYKKDESELFQVLCLVDKYKVYLAQKCGSLIEYCISALELSEPVAYNFVAVVRKSRQVPELKKAVTEGSVSISKAKKIVSVIDSKNQEQWIQLAQTQSTRNIEKAVVKVRPLPPIEKLKPSAENQETLQLTLPTAVAEMLKRAQDLHSSQKQSPQNLADSLKAVLEFYLHRNDPVMKAERAKQKVKSASNQNDAGATKTVHVNSECEKEEISLTTKPSYTLVKKRTPSSANKRTPIPANIKHEVLLRDQGQCTHIIVIAKNTNDKNPSVKNTNDNNSLGKRCENRRWLQLHHIKPVSEGGENKTSNLATLCSRHHNLAHYK